MDILRKEVLDIINELYCIEATEETTMNELNLNDFNFVEIIIKCENYLGTFIDEDEKELHDFDKMKDLIDWLINKPKETTKSK